MILFIKKGSYLLTTTFYVDNDFIKARWWSKARFYVKIGSDENVVVTFIVLSFFFRLSN